MSEKEGKCVKAGLFSVSAGRKLSGTLSLDGPGSILHLWSDSFFEVEMSEGATITGILENNHKVSLIGCVNAGIETYGLSNVSHHQKFFPHYVIIGNRHFSNAEKVISKVSMKIDDSTLLFHDRRSFRTKPVGPSDLSALSDLDIFSDATFEEMAIVSYFTGREEIFSADTVLGRISARNSVSFRMGGPEGAHINNEIIVDAEFPEPVDISDMFRRIRNLLRFFEIIAGRPQNLLKVNIVAVDQDTPSSSSVYFNMRSHRDRATENPDLQFYDTLVDPVENPRRFGDLICAWLKRDETWREARERFSTAWGKQRSYDADRVVGAANMFDLLPKEALPRVMPLPSDLAAAVEDCVTRLKTVPQSSRRDSALNALGRIKQPSLKEKIRHRSRLLVDVIGERIPSIDLATDASVDLRNFYVHGTPLTGRKKKLPDFQIFLTNTLEFVFCGSDLVELGWDIGSWCREYKGHPFGIYLYTYQNELSKLMRQLE